MIALAPKAIRWEPAVGIPESPCADFMLESYETGIAKLMLRYSWVKGNSFDLLLTFSETRAIRTYWDGDGHGDTLDLNHPRCSGAHSGYIWPLLEIEQSRWLNCGDFATSIAIAEATKQLPWRHYRILTLERSLDVLARGAIVGEWVAPANPGE
jgi:hypothetical protein